MGKILAIANQKGGVGKTTTAVNLSYLLACSGFSTLLVDLDPQANATVSINRLLKDNNFSYTSYHLLVDPFTEIEKILVNTTQKNLYILPAGPELAMVKNTSSKKNTVLREKILNSKKEFEWVIIDCPPSFSILNEYGFMISDEIIIPIQAEYLSLEGLSQMVNLIKVFNQINKRNIEICGILITMFIPFSSICEEVKDEVKRVFKEKLFDTLIYRDENINIAPSFGVPVIEYNITSIGSLTYFLFTKEVIQRCKRED